MNRVKADAKFESDAIFNYRLLLHAFQAHEVKKVSNTVFFTETICEMFGRHHGRRKFCTKFSSSLCYGTSPYTNLFRNQYPSSSRVVPDKDKGLQKRPDETSCNSVATIFSPTLMLYFNKIHLSNSIVVAASRLFNLSGNQPETPVSQH